MWTIIGDHYLTLKALHIIAMIAWMAGMLYLPRLFVYHASATPGSELAETLKIMERRLLRFIMTPAMIATWIFGLLLVIVIGLTGPNSGWLHAKLLFVVLLSGMHGVFAKWVRVFAADANTRPQRFYRVVNEIPTVLMIGIVFLVILKPF